MARTRAAGSGKGESITSVAPPRVPRSAFDRSYVHKTTIDSAYLYPLYIEEALPGDTFHIQPSYFARMSTPIRPFMDGLHLDYQFFACPLRLLWTNFVRMMGERDDPADHNDYTVPVATSPSSPAGYQVQWLQDYLELPPEMANVEHSNLACRMYNLIWNTWYRDANLQDSVVVDLDDGPDDYTDYVLLKRGKRKDYFSGALPFAQRGTAVSLPLGTSATGVIDDPTIIGTGTAPSLETGGGSGGRKITGSSSNTTMIYTSNPFASGGATGYPWENPQVQLTDPNVTVDLSTATAATINDIRVALATQHLLERDARGGGRYREIVLSHFGVQTDDIRLMRPELLATGSIPIQVNPVVSTNDSAAVTLGELAAYVTAIKVGRGFVKSFTEHCLIMGIVSVRADLTYQQGLPRMYSRSSRLDFYWPDLALIGEQAVLNKEIFCQPSDGFDDDPWGYVPRYEEYRLRNSIVTGRFRSTYASSLDVWHLALDFGTSRPSLNAAFIEEAPPVDRVVVTTAEPEFLIDCFYKVTAVRPIPKVGTPGMVRF